MEQNSSPQLTPIENAIKDLDKRIVINGGLDVATLQWVKGFILTELLPYERTYIRGVAEKAIFWASENYDRDRLGVERVDRENYLNQNHPL